jgi:mannose-6-phosphate isomerase-like protein (cupin superfamily)
MVCPHASRQGECLLMPYITRVPPSPTFVGKGLKGFQLEPRSDVELDIYLVDVTKGHDTFLRSKKITRFYYVVTGTGYFTIEGERYGVEPGVLVDVPPNVEYSYSGCMTLIVIGHPRWFKGNEEVTKKNPDVFPGTSLGRLISKLGLGKE